MEKISMLGAHLRGASNLLRFIPEPKSTLSSSFGGVMKAVGSTLAEGEGRSAISLDPTYQNLLEKQIELQEQMQLVSMSSNIEKTRHESKMAAVRNFRAG